MQRLINFLSSGICIVLYSLHIDARCPTEITCNDMTNCYMIYAQSNDWYYYHRRPGESNKNIGGNPPSSPSRYLLKRVSTKTRSLTEIERECQESGANIVMINSDQEYDQLTENILHVLSFNQKSIFSTKVANLPKERASATCGRVTVKDTILNEVDIDINQCYKDQTVNSILCESNPTDVVVCPYTTTVTPTNKITTTVKMFTTEATTSSNSTPENTTTVMIESSARETTEREQTSDDQSEKQPLKQSNEMSSNTMLFILVPLSVVVFLVVIAITCFIVGRRKKKRTNEVSSSHLGVESNDRESNIYAEEVVLLNEPSVSLNVASETVHINSNSHYENASDQVASQNTERKLTDDNHYNVPKKQNVYEYLSYQSSENKPRPDQRKEVHSTEHYSVPRPSVNKPPNECIYQEPGPAGDSSVVQNNNYDVPKVTGKENDADNCSNLYESEFGNTVGSASINYDTPKSTINAKNECNDKKQNSGKVAKKPPVKPPEKDSQPDSVDQYDTPTSIPKKPASAKHTPAKPALKPRSKSQNMIEKNNSNRAQNRQKHKVPSKYDIPVSYTNGENNQKEQQASKQKSSASALTSSDVYAVPKAATDHEYTRMDKARKTDDEQYYTPKSDNQYENYSGETQNKQEKPEPVSSTLHYDVPRTANEYESFDGMDKDQTQDPISTKHYDVPRVPNVYEQCDNNVKKQPVQTLHVSNALYETLGDDDKIKSSKKSKKTGKQKSNAKSQASKTVAGYMSYDGEQQGNDHYQELDKSTNSIIKFR